VCLPVLFDNGLKVDIRATLLQKTSIEGRGGLATGFPYFIQFECPLNDVSY
jgi:hypothetical protein